MVVDGRKYDSSPNSSFLSKTVNLVCDAIEKPIVWFRETIVEPNQKEHYWYHEKIRRVPTIDECYVDDVMCRYEAEMQFKRDKKVDRYILKILQKRFEHCKYEYADDLSRCDALQEYHTKAMENYYNKYGDMGFMINAYTCLMRQKHRMAWERRHGPIGQGRKPEDIVLPDKSSC